MPTLADIYSAIDSAKRRAGDFVGNPLAGLAQMYGNANDRARTFNELNTQAAQESMQSGQMFGPKTRQLANTLAEAYNPIGMTVYHGSPHLFERFDLGKIGTGEGNQSYGRGLYMAQARPTAEEYRKALSTPEVVLKSGERISSPQLGTGEDVAKAWLEEAYLNKDANPFNTAISKISKLRNSANNPMQFDDALNVLKKWQSEGANVDLGGALYKVDLPDTHIRRMLDWDEQLKNQPKHVRDLAKSLGMDMNDMGGDLLAKVGKGEEGKQILEKAGIRGIKYLDEKSRYSPYQVEILHKGKPYATSEYATKRQAEQYAKEREAEGFGVKHRMVGTRNFVVFDPNHLTILERNSEKIK